MRITKEEVAAVADLARIGLDEEGLARAERDLSGILDYVARLAQVPTEGVPEASAAIVPANQFRPDVVDQAPDSQIARIQENFPAREGALLKVPAVFEKPKK